MRQLLPFDRNTQKLRDSRSYFFPNRAHHICCDLAIGLFSIAAVSLPLTTSVFSPFPWRVRFSNPCVFAAKALEMMPHSLGGSGFANALYLPSARFCQSRIRTIRSLFQLRPNPEKPLDYGLFRAFTQPLDRAASKPCSTHNSTHIPLRKISQFCFRQKSKKNPSISFEIEGFPGPPTDCKSELSISAKSILVSPSL